MDKRLEANMRFLCDESRMLTGITVAYGTTTYSEWAVSYTHLDVYKRQGLYAAEALK